MKKLASMVFGIAILLFCGCELNNIEYKGKVQMNSNKDRFIYKGISIHYEDHGNGQPIVLLHGFGASTYSWRHISEFFKKTNRVIAIDLKGFGLSDKPLDNGYSVLDQSYIILDFIRELNLKNVILVGHSLGGAVSLLTYLTLSNHEGNPISKLILIDTASYQQHLPAFIAFLRIPLLNKLSISLTSSTFKARMVLRQAFFDHSKITDDMVKTYGSYLSLPGASHALIKTAQQIVPTNIDEIIGRYRSIHVPVLIIWGDKDKVIPLEFGERLAKDIPQARFVVVQNCGHIPQEECQNQTIEAMSAFLSN